MTREGPTEITIPEIERSLQRGVSAADPDRAAGLAQLARLGEALEGGLRREYARLSKVLPPGDPRLEGLILRLEAGQTMRREAGFEVERSAMGVPAPDKGAWLLYGFVRGVDPGFFEDKSIALADANGRRVPEAETPIEKDGRFLLRLAAPASPERERAAGFEVFVQIVDGRNRAVHKDPRGMRPENGRITYLEITLPPEKPAPSPERPERPQETPSRPRERRPSRRGGPADEPPTRDAPTRRGGGAARGEQPESGGTTRRGPSRSPRRRPEGGGAQPR